MGWKDMTKAERVEAIQISWEKDCSATTLASDISKRTGSIVSRNAIIGIYNRTLVLRESHPLSGGGRIAAAGRMRGTRAAMANWKAAKEARLVRPRKSHEQRKPKRKPPVTAIIDISEKISKVGPPRRSAASQEYDATSHLYTLVDLGLNQCHWPVNDPPPGGLHLFCGHATPEGQRYCAHHQGRSMSQRQKD